MTLYVIKALILRGDSYGFNTVVKLCENHSDVQF